MGWYAEGPIERPGDVAAALKRAIERVKAGQPALLDTITRDGERNGGKTVGVIGARMR
jgi:hypothetical protein